MCGIIAVLNSHYGNVSETLIGALERLEYRGYDSSGIAYIDSQKKTHKIRSVGKIKNLIDDMSKYVETKDGCSGIGHTRWATHGGVTVENAHPHSTNGVSIVHNGIIENYEELKKTIDTQFESETDSEVISQLISKFIKSGMSFRDAFFKTLGLLRGTYAIVAIYDQEPDILLGAKKGSPMAVGYKNDDHIYIASDAIALSSLSDNVIYMEEGDVVIAQHGKYTIFDENLNEVVRNEVKNNFSLKDVNKGEHEDYMLKEIYEEPNVLINTYNNFVNPIDDIKKYKSLTLVACGTSYYAGVLAKYWIEDIAEIRVNVEIASEFRYRNPVLDADGLYIFISQSGETIDTLCAMRKVIEKGYDTLSIVNVDSSSIARESKYTTKTHAGVEMGVASTKAFISQALTLLLLAVPKDGVDVHHIAASMQNIIDTKTEIIKEIAENVANSRLILYIGRGTSFPISLEGSLKMKEITYISSEGCPSGEIKHGPIALVDENVYTIVLAPQDRYYEKTMSNAQEILARNGKVLMIGPSPSKCFSHKNIEVVEVDNAGDLGNPFVLTTIVHLLAYYTAKSKGLDVDKPRNLAKSVTVE